MLFIGKYNDLIITRDSDQGLYLEDPQGEEVLLPNRYVTDDMRPDDRLRVFVYTDSEDRPVATTEKPLALRDEFAYLKVADVNNSGAFLDWGLSKDLFVPFSEQLTPMERNEKYLVFLYLDRLTSRMLASPRLNQFLDNARLTIAEGDEVDLIIWERTDLGYNVIVNEFHKGLVFKSDIFKTLHIGDRMKGFVKKIREENKLDITLEKIGIERFEPLIQRIVDALKDNSGYLPLHDDSPPEEISKTLGMSKRNFKKSIGSLWKSGVIQFEDEGIRLK